MIMKGKPHQNNKGFTLVEALVGVALLGIVLSVSLKMMTEQLQRQQANEVYTSLVTMRQNILAHITSPQSWEETKKRNLSLRCMLNSPHTCVPGAAIPINLYKSDKTILVETLNGASGMNYSMQPCGNYGAVDTCVFKARVFWQIVCDGAPGCHFPSEKVSVRFSTSKPDRWHVAKYNMQSISRPRDSSDADSPVITCVNKGDMMFIGHAQSFTNASGSTVTADSEGCVPLAEFKGPMGTTVAGPPGPPGVPAPTPGPTPTPTPGPGGPRGAWRATSGGSDSRCHPFIIISYGTSCEIGETRETYNPLRPPFTSAVTCRYRCVAD